jgi:hypothetical protein
MKARRWRWESALATALLAAMAGTRAPAGEPPMGSTAFLDYKNGFRDAQLGSPPSKIAGLGPLAEGDDLRCATRESEKLELGPSKLSKVQYCFLDGKLARIEVTFATVVDTELGLQGLTEAWGNPLSITRSPQPDVARRLSWVGDKVRAVLETREHVGSGGTIIFLSTSLVAHQKERSDQRDKQRQERFGKDL